LGGSLGTTPQTYAPQICAASAAGCAIPSEGTGPIPIQCNQLSDCEQNGSPGATACCLQGATVPAMQAGCTYLKSTKGNAILCENVVDGGTDGGSPAATACTGSGDVQVCSADIDCPSGMHCIPGKWKIYQIGFCQ